MTHRTRIALLPLLLLACSSADGAPTSTQPPSEAGVGDNTAPDMDGGADAQAQPAISFPKLVSSGGPVLKNPKVKPIFFPGDPLQSTLLDFTTKLAKSTYWADVTREYGVGGLTVLPPVAMGAPAPRKISDKGVRDWLRTQLSDGGDLGPPDSETIYAIHYPASTTVEFGPGDASCVTFGGYHDEVAVGAVNVPVVVMPRCDNVPNPLGVTELERTTSALSHEYVEAATDPFIYSAPAYARVDDAHWAWSATAGGGEVSDLCFLTDVLETGVGPADIGHRIQRQWSNSLAAAGHAPCQPTSGAYFVAVPQEPDDIDVSDLDGTKGTIAKGIRVKRGEPREVDVFLYADAAVDAVALGVSDTQFMGPSGVTATFATQKASQGAHVKLTISGRIATRAVLYTTARIGNRVGTWPMMILVE